MKRKSIHERTLDNVVLRLKSKRYDWIKRHWKYKTNNLEGELDILAYKAGTNCFHYYEIKSRDNVRNYIKAIMQYDRVRRAYPELEIKGVYVTPTLVRRIMKLERQE